jgi:peptidoglycan/LPS O-acetylase OafA/YrhL
MEVHARLPGIHGLRCVAALSVLVFHLVPNLPALPSSMTFTKNYLGAGVQLFFVLSAFSLMYSTSRTVGRQGWFEDYLTKRYFRIAPLFYVMMLFFLVFNYFYWKAKPELSVILFNVTFLYNFLPDQVASLVWAGWTLGVEMLFYAAFPLLILTLRSLRSSLVFLLICILLCGAMRELWVGKSPPDYSYMSVVANLQFFAAGIAAYHLTRKLQSADLNRWQLHLVLPTLAIMLFLFPRYVPATSQFMIGLYLGVGAVMYGVLATWQALVPTQPFTSRFFQHCGERSYSLYLLHAPIVWSLTSAYVWVHARTSSVLGEWSALLSIALGMTCVIIAAEVTYRLIEQPSIKAGAWLIARRRQ